LQRPRASAENIAASAEFPSCTSPQTHHNDYKHGETLIPENSIMCRISIRRVFNIEQRFDQLVPFHDSKRNAP